MKKLYILIFILSPLFSSAKGGRSVQAFHFREGVKPDEYVAKTIVFKFRPEFRSTGLTDLQNLFAELGASQPLRKFPNVSRPEKSVNNQGQKLADLSLIYEFQYSGSDNLEAAINKVLATGKVEYAEPHFIPKVLYAPNDPSTGNQYYLNSIKAYQGWDISKGDSSIIIGITDTGVDTDHPDMVGSYKYNYADPINGVDDDGDGYKDNFLGWDIGSNDNDASVDPLVNSWYQPLHGASVAGIAGGTFDNGIGIAGVGAKSKILPIKITDPSGQITAGYEGVIYAADHGCKVINCSWGDMNRTQVGQDAVTYATINRGALVVAAAGNHNTEDPYYPASLDYVVSVASTEVNDQKRVDSSYGVYIDVAAPGQLIYTASYDNSYKSEYGGTSFASPIVSGCAGIVRFYYPSYSPLQVAEQIRVTSDNIDNFPGNENFTDKLGSGRVNLFRALTETHPAVRFTNISVTDNNDSLFIAGDTLRIVSYLVNYLQNGTGVTATLSTKSPYVTILDSTTSIGNLNTLATANNLTDPFLVKILGTIPPSAKVAFKITFTAAGYSDKQSFEVLLNPDYLNIKENNVQTTITSKGRIGFNAWNVDGLGFGTAQTSNMLYEMGLMIGNNATQVSDCVRGSSQTPDDQFSLLQVVRKQVAPMIGDYEALTVYNDDKADTLKLGIEVKENTFLWKSSPFRDFIVKNYFLTNKSTNTYDSIYVGLFADWDIMNAGQNIGATDTTHKVGYVKSTQANSPFAGIKVIGKSSFNHYVMEGIPGGNGGIDNTNGFSDGEKFLAMNSKRFTSASSTDISHVVSSGPYHLGPNDTVSVAFAILAESSLAKLLGDCYSVDSLFQIKNTGVHRLNSDKVSLVPNPASSRITANFDVDQFSKLNLSVFNMLGETVMVLRDKTLVPGQNHLNIDVNALQNGIYYFQAEINGKVLVEKIVITR